MPIGIVNATNVSMVNILDIANSSSIPEFMIKVDYIVYGGYLYFTLLWVLWIILFFAAQQKENQILTNAMYSGAIVSILSLFIRAMVIIYKGFIIGMLSDYQMWMFPLITIMIAIGLWISKR